MHKLHERVLHGEVFTHRQRGEEGFGQVHQRILQRAGLFSDDPVAIEAGFVQAVAAGEALRDHFQDGVEHRFHQRLADFVPVMGAGEQDEGVGVEVFTLIQRRAL